MRMNERETRKERSTDTYLSILPRNPGMISRLVAKFIFSRVRFGPEHTEVIRALPADALIVYVMTRKSRLAHLFFHTRYARLGLPTPEVNPNCAFIFRQPFGRLLRIGRHYLRHLFRHYRLPDPEKSNIYPELLLSGRGAMLALAEHRAFLKRFTGRRQDPLQMLIQLQERVDAPIYLVPQLFVYGKKPDSSGRKMLSPIFGSPKSVGSLRKLSFLIFRSAPIIAEVSEPVNLNSVLNLFEKENVRTRDRAMLLGRSLMAQLDRHHQSITGPVLKSAEALKQMILTHPQLVVFMGKYAARRRLPLHQVRREAVDYLNEIAAKYRPRLVSGGIRIVRWLMKQMFDGVSVNVEGLSAVKRYARKGPLIFMPCHRSHFDYFIVPYILYTHNLPWPHIFAGKNLSFFPMGPFFRGVGAFFVRRTFAGAVFYTKVFSAYIHMLLKEGFNIKVYIEGGRSRTGKLLPPKLGMINILLNACLGGACNDLNIVPIYVGYDSVPEEAAYVAESAGVSKNDESFTQILRAGRLLKKRYGKVYVRFDQPFSLSSLLKQFSVEGDGQAVDNKTRNAICRAIGYRAVNAIDRRCVVTPQSLVAGALLNTGKGVASQADICSQVRTYLYHLCCQYAELSVSLLKNHESAIRHVLKDFLDRKLIVRLSRTGSGVDDEPVFRVPVDKRAALEYYKNNCISFFIPAAYAALSILEMDVLQFSTVDVQKNYRFLRHLFSLEFPQYTDAPSSQIIRKILKTFIDDEILSPHSTLPDTYRITSPGLRKLRCYARYLAVFVDAYRIVLSYLGQFSRNAHSRDIRLKKIRIVGQRRFKQKTILRKEALSRMYYQNALDHFLQNGIRGKEDMAAILEADTRLSRYADLLN